MPRPEPAARGGGCTQGRPWPASVGISPARAVAGLEPAPRLRHREHAPAPQRTASSSPREWVPHAKNRRRCRFRRHPDRMRRGSNGATAPRLSRHPARRRRRALPRHPHRRSLPLDGRPRCPGGGRLGRRAEHGDHVLSRRAAAAGPFSRAPHRAVGLRAHGYPAARRRPAVLLAQQRAATPGAGVHARRARRRARTRARSQRDLRRRLGLAGAVRALARREAARLRAGRGRRRLAHDPRARYRLGQGSCRRGALDALLGHRVDPRRQGILLLALPRTTREQGAGSATVGARVVLPPHRHAAGRGRAGLRTPRPRGLGARWQRHRGRPLPADHAGQGRGQQQPAALRGPRRSAGAAPRRAGARARRERRRRVRADRQRGRATLPPHRPGRAESQGRGRRHARTRSGELADRRARAAAGTGERGTRRRALRRAIPGRREQPAPPVRARRHAAAGDRAARRGKRVRAERTAGRPRCLVRLQLAADADHGLSLRSRNAAQHRLRAARGADRCQPLRDHRGLRHLARWHPRAVLRDRAEGLAPRRRQPGDALRLRRLLGEHVARLPRRRPGLAGTGRRLGHGEPARRRRIRRGLAPRRHARQQAARVRRFHRRWRSTWCARTSRRRRDSA